MIQSSNMRTIVGPTLKLLKNQRAKHPNKRLIVVFDIDQSALRYNKYKSAAMRPTGIGEIYECARHLNYEVVFITARPDVLLSKTRSNTNATHEELEDLGYSNFKLVMMPTSELKQPNFSSFKARERHKIAANGTIVLNVGDLADDLMVAPPFHNKYGSVNKIHTKLDESNDYFLFRPADVAMFALKVPHRKPYRVRHSKPKPTTPKTTKVTKRKATSPTTTTRPTIKRTKKVKR